MSIIFNSFKRPRYDDIYTGSIFPKRRMNTSRIHYESERHSDINTRKTSPSRDTESIKSFLKPERKQNIFPGNKSITETYCHLYISIIKIDWQKNFLTKNFIETFFSFFQQIIFLYNFHNDKQLMMAVSMFQ